MIAKTHRFHGRGSLNYVYKNGRAVRGESVSLRIADNKRDDYRLAVVVSRKVSKSAVVRNRIRRRIYEAVRVQKKVSAAKWPVDMVITVFDERIAKAPSDVVHTSVAKLLQKARLVS